ncbi:hypothetical protein AVEN_184258-1 [Araneus ventricosus]|uniref:Uncharacterized protein n=1 Tax=Araneus ventricosus TaxID=182803 RepID=A0A4Y2GMY8_ARAVE|nr:hypothetical protein AVEN_184258-1 [Araneus ventricosus]
MPPNNADLCMKFVGRPCRSARERSVSILDLSQAMREGFHGGSFDSSTKRSYYFAPGHGLALGSPAFIVVNGKLFAVDKARVSFLQESHSYSSHPFFLSSGMLGTGRDGREDDFLGVTLNEEAIAMKTVYHFLMEQDNASNALDNLEKTCLLPCQSTPVSGNTCNWDGLHDYVIGLSSSRHVGYSVNQCCLRQITPAILGWSL